MSFRAMRRALLAVTVLALATAGTAAAEDEARGIDPNQGESLVEVTLASKAAAIRLQLEADSYGVEFNDHYLRKNRGGTYTVTVFGTEDDLDALAAAGYEIGATIEGPDTWRARLAERQADVRDEKRADAAALGDPITVASHENELVVLRVDYFENYAGRFLSVEAKTRLGRVEADGTGYDPAAPTLSLSWNTGAGTPIGSAPRTMDVNVDPDTTPDTYVEHRELVRIGDKDTTTPPRPTRIRIGSSTGASIEADVNTWLGPGLPPMASGYLKDFTTRYMDPTEVYGRFQALAQEFPNLANLIPLPYKTNGYQRKAQTTLAPVGTTFSVAAAAGATDVRVTSTAGLAAGQQLALGPSGSEVKTIQAILNANNPNPNLRFTTPLASSYPVGAQLFRPGTQFDPGVPTNNAAINNNPNIGPQSAVVLTSRAWGHEGGNSITAELRHPGAPNTPLSVAVVGNDILVMLATDAAGALTSTAADVIAAINASPQARQLVVATTYRNNAGAGIAQPRAKIALRDFLDVPTNAHVPRGPFQYSVMRIGKVRDGSKVGVFLYCQQHAREWATPLTCLETAEQLLRNYAIDPTVRELVDNLDIFILPSSNPDGSHYSIHNFFNQRRNMTNWCMEGGEETDDPFAANFWQPRVNPQTGQPYFANDPNARNVWGVDLNRNNTFGTIWDGYIGASADCTSDVYAGPGAFAPGTEPKPGEASEPEIKNELWISDQFKNIKFSNNIHSFGGYFMWAPGTYLPDRSEGEAVHPNIGVEKYFFEAGERILRRIEQHRDTVILPERTGPIADVLYSAAGNSADEHWYKRGTIAYSFETGADRFGTTLAVASAPGATGVRLNNRIGIAPGEALTIDTGASQEVRTVASVAASNPQSPAPNVTLTAPLNLAHAAGAPASGGTIQTAVGFQPDYASEGKHEALEFAAGNIGLLESALDYARDNTAPQVDMTGPRASRTPIETTFRFVNEPSVIRYTIDGSTPTETSTLWDSTGPREPGQTFHISTTTTFRWMATDIKGNVSTGSARFVIDTEAPVTTASVNPVPSGGFVNVTLTAEDREASGGSGVQKTEYRVDGGPWTTYGGTFSVAGYGDHTVEYFSTDFAGNVEGVKSIVASVRAPAAAPAALKACGVTIASTRIRAQQRVRVRATVTLAGSRLAGARVVLRGPGISRSVIANGAGVASTVVRATRAGTLRARVAANSATLGCSASKRIFRALVRRGSATPELTGRP